MMALTPSHHTLCQHGSATDDFRCACCVLHDGLLMYRVHFGDFSVLQSFHLKPVECLLVHGLC